MDKHRNIRTGFTLLEMLLVIAIIAILAGIVIVAINPAKQLGDANNAQRHSDILSILNAVHQYSIDNSGSITALGIPIEDGGTLCDDDDVDDITDDNHICIYDADDSCADGVDLDVLATSTGPNYITDIPVDPLQPGSSTLTDADVTGYIIFQDADNNRITVCAPYAENDEDISITR